ncbi:MAG: hypothetical protein N2117_01125 [Anaerolineales bacterium]|nr:hypothetical protein [Anaerolineales bacterium]MCX7753833.1 hypothetical protein [Anaerolineales bacterium]MDW8276429.1 hypothetical protein [Anaerolineales bacterium]
MSEKTCLNCGRTSQQIPLLFLEYRDKQYTICPQCMPVLIHKPHTLAARLPGAEQFNAAQPEH